MNLEISSEYREKVETTLKGICKIIKVSDDEYLLYDYAWWSNEAPNIERKNCDIKYIKEGISNLEFHL